jgi:hypothetical protein
MLAGVNTPEAKHEVGQLKDHFDQCAHLVKTAPQTVPPLDLSRFKTSAQATDIASYFEEQVATIKIEETDVTAEAAAKATEELARLRAEQAENALKVKAEIAETEARIVQLESKMTTRDTTADDVAAANPEFEAKWQEKLKNNQWAPGF